MTTESVVASESLTLHDRGNQPITPAERWVLICENVYTRAQKRGFVGGNPLQDLADAEQEIDAAYETDFDGVFALTSTAEITEQLKSVFAGYGVDQEHLSCLLDGHQEALETLAATNRERLDDTSGPAATQTQILKNVASEAVQALQSLAQGLLRPEGVFRIAESSMQELDNVLTGSQGLANSASTVSEDQPRDASGHLLLQGVVASDYKDCSAEQLRAAPISALKGISISLGKRLEEELAISTIGEMAANKHAEWAQGVVLLADAELATEGSADVGERKDLQAVADSPITDVRDIGESQARLLKEEFGIETVRDLGTHHLFNVARTIVILAKSEG
jgi:hypothetical protein